MKKETIAAMEHEVDEVLSEGDDSDDESEEILKRRLNGGDGSGNEDDEMEKELAMKRARWEREGNYEAPEEDSQDTDIQDDSTINENFYESVYDNASEEVGENGRGAIDEEETCDVPYNAEEDEEIEDMAVLVERQVSHEDYRVEKTYERYFNVGGHVSPVSEQYHRLKMMNFKEKTEKFVTSSLASSRNNKRSRMDLESNNAAVISKIHANIEELEQQVQHLDSFINRLTESEQHREQFNEVLFYGYFDVLAHKAQMLSKETNYLMKQLVQLSNSNRTLRIHRERLQNEYIGVLNRLQRCQRRAAQTEKASMRRIRDAAEQQDAESMRKMEEEAYDREKELQRQRQQEINLNEFKERQQALQQLEQDIGDVNQIFADLARIVHDQGDMVDSIEANVEHAQIHVEQFDLRMLLKHAAVKVYLNDYLTMYISSFFMILYQHALSCLVLQCAICMEAFLPLVQNLKKVQSICFDERKSESKTRKASDSQEIPQRCSDIHYAKPSTRHSSLAEVFNAHVIA
ncbi:SNARE domain protein [Dictyocaulus viviparus]|uniref:SNARE domain protein n=1 Tax=Dictyocaulus viviparus TaxID=29172 RepID=A0A0D8XYH8_DICVI|nr:SNARE domain protein [Dictyocaulus viviparus]